MADFRYFNENPYGYEDSDCVTRAITLATGEDYLEVGRKLYLIGELLNMDKLDVNCYEFLITKYYGFPPVRFEKGTTVGEFAENHPRGIYLIRMQGHITTLVDGELWDLWNSSEYHPTNIWFCGL